MSRRDGCALASHPSHVAENNDLFVILQYIPRNARTVIVVCLKLHMHGQTAIH